MTRSSEYEARLRRLALGLSLAEEAERRRLASGLDEGVGNSLALAREKLDSLRRDPALRGDRELEEIRRLIDQTIQAARVVTFDLSSPVLYEHGLEAALESMGEQLIEGAGVRFAFHSDEVPKPLSLSTEVVLHRAVEELLTNVVTHASATAVALSVSKVDDRIEIRVIDDGVGLGNAVTDGAVKPQQGLGLLGVAEQLRAIQGRMELETSPGRWTKVLLVAPLDEPVDPRLPDRSSTRRT